MLTYMYKPGMLCYQTHCILHDQQFLASSYYLTACMQRQLKYQHVQTSWSTVFPLPSELQLGSAPIHTPLSQILTPVPFSSIPYMQVYVATVPNGLRGSGGSKSQLYVITPLAMIGSSEQKPAVRGRWVTALTIVQSTFYWRFLNSDNSVKTRQITTKYSYSDAREIAPR